MVTGGKFGGGKFCFVFNMREFWPYSSADGNEEGRAEADCPHCQGRAWRLLGEGKVWACLLGSSAASVDCGGLGQVIEDL